jgi:hypothetical protein
MGKLSSYTLTEPTFIEGSLYPAGATLTLDLSKYGLKSPDDTLKPTKDADPSPIPLAPNLVAAGKAEEAPAYQVAAVAPAGPNPDAPQAVPPGATLAASGAPVTEEGSAITPETTAKAK